jgi:hypothetical protein
MAGDAHVIFLHIPKTAGQSVHAFLVRLFGQENVSPARVNEHLTLMTIADLRRHRVISGHLDWETLDCIEQPRFVFTILREPMERILSFYLFLRREADRIPEAELALPHNRGRHAVKHLSCDEYFCGGPPGIRAFLDSHYDNFYTYYFAGRRYDARARLLAKHRADASLGPNAIVDMALANLETLDGVYPMDGLSRLEADLYRVAGKQKTGQALPSIHANRGDGGDGRARMDTLRAMGATTATFDKIEAMTKLDRVIWDQVNRSFARPVQAAPIALGMGTSAAIPTGARLKLGAAA